MRLGFHRQVRVDLASAHGWYEARSQGLGERFLEAVDEAFAQIAERPYSSPTWPGIDAARGIRRRLVRGYPYSIAYDIRGDLVFVLAVAHQRRHPRHWFSRR